MNILIIGAGRMGVRHAQGAIKSKCFENVFITDTSNETLERATQQLGETVIPFTAIDTPRRFDIVIVSTTAANRLEVCKYALTFSPSYILLEKPLGQSIEEVRQIISLFENRPIKVAVNFNTRLYPFIQQLKYDLKHLPQFKGIKHISFNFGAIGISSNGIHFLDLLFFLLDSTKAKLTGGDIDEEAIASGRGSNFCDFGGWASIYFFDDSNSLVGRALLSISAGSSVYGGWEIVGSHGRIRINELENERVDILRNKNSTLPVNRYAAEYLSPTKQQIDLPALSDLTCEWIQKIATNGESILPLLPETFKTHELLFQWLSLSKKYSRVFPIT